MFFGPVYPALVAAAMRLNPRFAAAARCSVEANNGHRDISTCDPYDLPMRLLNALLLALAVIAVASTAEMIFRPSLVASVADVDNLQFCPQSGIVS